MALQTNTSDPALPEERSYETDQELKRVLKAGRLLAHTLPGEELVVTGMSGRFPDSDDVYHYRSNLFHKVDMVSCDNRRWEPTHPEIPQRTGKLNFIEKFDPGFFGIHYRQANTMDPMCRHILERSFEAILDAGIHPSQLRGTNTGVFIGACFSESEKTWFYDKLESPTFGLTGCTRSMQAQRISYYLGLEGPSYMTDTACSSSLYAFEHAYRAIREGRCDSALVGGASLCLHPIVSLQFARLGVLSLDGSCKSFDADANGYARSETISMVYLQKSKDARRIYAQVVHAKANCDGYKEQGITYPSGPTQKKLLEEVYQECNIDPASIDFLEAHATGTKVGDPEEIMAMDEVFCTTRTTPLFVGSIKSNLGHTEPASGMCSLVKVLLGMENNCILPNINYTRPREGAEALEKGRMIVVTETTPWPSNGSGLAAINSFGFGGANCHILLKRFLKPKINNGQPRDDIPRLVCVSGRTEEAIKHILNKISGIALDAEYVGLLHEAFVDDIIQHPYKGYTIISKTKETKRSFRRFDGERLPLAIVFSGASDKWLTVGKELFTVPLFAATIQKIHTILLQKTVNITDIIFKESPANIIDVLIGNVAVQIALVDILKTLQLKIDYFLGYSTGELASAYADGALTLKQTVLAAYYIGSCLHNLSEDTSRTNQAESGKLEIHKLLSTDVGLSTTSKKMTQFNNDIINNEVTNEIENNDELHAKIAKQIGPKLLERLREIIPEPKQRSSNWITTSVTKSRLTSDIAKYASAEYFLNNLLDPVLFSQATFMIPQKSNILIIGSELKIPNLNVVHLVSTTDVKGNVISLLNGLGRIYELGHNCKLANLYPKVHWPVGVGTPMISPLIKWNHTEDWFVTLYKVQERMKSGERMISFAIKDTDWAFLSGHVIDGRNLVPATAYICLVWETFSMMMGLLMTDTQVVFENIKFQRATNIPKSGTVQLMVMVQKGTAKFEVAEMGQTVCSGFIYIPDDFSNEMVDLPKPIRSLDHISLAEKDIYKELKLRGYNYSGLFHGLKKCNLEGTAGSIEWTSNWISFMDNMLQIKLLADDTRNLYVPTEIERLVVDAKAHIRYARKFGEKPVLPVYINNETGIIKSGAIEIRGLNAASIARRKVLGEPVLETHKFIPFETKLSREQSVRANTQLLLENHYVIKLRVVEIIDEITDKGAQPLGPIIRQALSDLPLIQPEIVVLSKEPLQLSNVTVEDKKLTGENHSCSLVVVSKILNRPEMVQQALTALKDYGMILSREGLDFKPQDLFGLEVLSIHQTPNEKLVLLRKSTEFAAMVIDVSKSLNDFDWLSTLQTALRSDKKVLLLAQNQPFNGILGLVNCLRREPGGMNIKCVFIMSEAPIFDINNEFYAKQLKKGLAINVFKDGKWGTYKHLLLEKAGVVQREHAFNNVTVRGDLASLTWIEGELTTDTILPPEKELVHIYCASINFRDIMTASGRINNDVITKDRIEQYNVQGFEFSGRNKTGKRIMGMVTSGALASMVTADSYLIWDIPDEWSMEDAATIPVTYGTVMQGLILIAKIKAGQSILIHAGSGGVGQAAINIALYYKCNIFTTVGTQEKREFIKKQFPQIPESHIGNSRDTSFEQMILKETNNRGVDVILNSLAEEKLQASIRCLAPGGNFIEIGKFDLASNNSVGLKTFTEGRSFHGVMLDAFFSGAPTRKYAVANLISEGLRLGAVKPLSRITFKQNEVENAFRYMASGKHTGKVIITIRQEESEKEIVPERRLFNCIPRFQSNPENCYVICGGLGGFGLELADWLVIRGAKKLVLVSRKGLTTGYQASRMRIWKSYGVTTIISTADITTKEGCESLIKEANKLGHIDGIFNLAVVLKDGLLENQNEDSFIKSLAPKAIATLHLDAVTREMCPRLQYFVVFSSVSCGRGNAGQTNYGMANSVMERICEKRKADGYAAMAIQWGAIGEVGLVAEMQDQHTEIEIGGTIQQRISSCLNVMDIFLRQTEPIVSSIVVAEKKSGAAGADNIIDAIKNVMGIRDLKTVSLHATLPELGMDSMMAVEIKQTLEREYEVFLTAQDIRSMTFTRLLEIAHKKMAEADNQEIAAEEKEKLPQGVNLLLRFVGDEENANIRVVRLTSLIKEKAVAPKVFLLPGIEGMASVLEPLACNLSSHAFCLQYTFSENPELTIEDMAKSLLPHIQENLPKNTPFTLVSYSFGTVVALQIASLLEEDGRIGRVILIDGSPAMFEEFLKQQMSEVNSKPVLETIILCALMQLYMPLEMVLKHKKEIANCKTLEERVEMALNSIPGNVPHTKKYQREVCISSCARMSSLLIYKPTFPKLKSIVKLFKPSRPTLDNFDDFKVQELCEKPVEETLFEGNHLTILKNPQLAYAINKIIDISSTYFKQSHMNEMAELENLKETNIKKVY